MMMMMMIMMMMMMMATTMETSLICYLQRCPALPGACFLRSAPRRRVRSDPR